MFKTLQKSLLTVTFLAGTLSAFAQASLIVEEHFNTLPEWAQRGYTEKNGCEPNATATPPIKVTFPNPPGPDIVVEKTYPSTVAVTYTIKNGAIEPTCTPKGGENGQVSNGYVDLNRGDASLTISIKAFVTVIDLAISATGSTGRFVQVGKSLDGGITWDTILSHATTSQRPSAVQAQTNLVQNGRLYRFLPVNAANPLIRVFGNANYLRINDLYVDGTIIAGLEKGSLFENGAKVLVSDNNVTVTSPKNGTVQLLNVNGSTVDQKDIRNEVSFTNLHSGLHIVKLMVDNQVSIKKVIVQ